MIAKSWFGWCWQWQIGGCVAIVGALSGGVSDRVLAQIVPDNTLGAEGSVVTPNPNIRGIPSNQIDGGARRGTNLFHSFTQFNIDAGRGAYFTNPAGILNILTRVTGANRSDILGRLGVLGDANLFLINPNGIVFGPAASLDVQGSFLATTANAVKLGDAGLFSASQPATSNLLTVSPSALWFNAVAAQPIVNRSQAQSLIGQPNLAGLSPGLQVQPGRTLALIGGDVLLEGGNLTAAGGRIELGSVARVGQVSLSQTGNSFVLGYDSINDFGKIALSIRAFVDASGEGGGSIQIRGGRLEMTQSSNIWANTLGAENGEEVLVRATEVVLSESSSLLAVVAPTGTGTGGDLRIDTGRLLVRDGARVSASTFGSGNGGSLQITASDSVEVIGTSADGRNSKLSVETSGAGAGGNLEIKTQRLTIQDGAQVSASTSSPNPNGEGGNILVNATQSLDLNQASLLAQSTGAAPAGNVMISTGNLTARNGTIATSSEQSSGGAISISASNIRLFGDSDITTNVNQGAGGGGNIYLKVDSIIAFDDSDILAYARDGKGGNIFLYAPVIFARIFNQNYRSFTELTDNQINQINTDSLLANSCIVRRHQPTRGSFTITGTGGLPQRPGDAQMSTFPTVDIETLPTDSTPTNTNPNRPWQKGDPIVEPQGVYRLPNGKLVLSRECP